MKRPVIPSPSLRSTAGSAKALLLLCAIIATPAAAHPLAPGLLEITQVAPTRYAVLWRTPVARAGAISVQPRLPEDCVAVAPPDVLPGSAEVMTARWLADCAGGLEGRALAVDGLPGSGINVIVRVVAQDGAEFRALLGADQASVTIDLAGDAVFAGYLALGAGHLVSGLDHALFLLGLFLLVGAGRRFGILVATVTAFTLGHSVTLCMAVLGFVPLSQAVAEALIAGTVLVLALELTRSRAGLITRRPWQMAAVFGLVHGLGFAGALRDVGLPADDLPLALLAFNLGIELAQLALIVALWLAARALRARPAPRPAQAVPTYVIGSMAACWLLERSVGLLA